MKVLYLQGVGEETGVKMVQKCSLFFTTVTPRMESSIRIGLYIEKAESSVVAPDFHHRGTKGTERNRERNRRKRENADRIFFRCFPCLLMFKMISGMR